MASNSKVAPFESLQNITDDFSRERELGTGPLGTVYMGTLPDGRNIAVKKHVGDAPGTDDKAAYRQKVESIMELKHDNIATLLAFCLEEREELVPVGRTFLTKKSVQSLLCYEYFPKGSLHDNLFGELASDIDWSTRFKIITGICAGLQYLHTFPGSIIHLHLKPQNILLGENMVPKITDFVYSRILGPDITRKLTSSSVGSVGYKAPEYLHKGEISARSDIYSLGLIILETTTKEIYSPSTDQESARKFINEVRENWTDQELILSEYPELEEESLRQLNSCINIGLKCVDLDQNNRPTIVQIVRMLNAQW